MSKAVSKAFASVTLAAWAVVSFACSPADSVAEPSGPDAGTVAEPMPVRACDAANASALDPATGTCYSLFVIPSTWEEAQRACESWGSDTRLVAIETAGESALLDSLVDPYPALTFWIGARAAAPEVPADGVLSGPWTWVTGEPMTFSNWGRGQPSQAYVEACAYLQMSEGNFRWKDDTCGTEYLYSFICETDPAP